MVQETRSGADGTFSLVVHAGRSFVHAELDRLASDDEECDVADGGVKDVRFVLEEGVLVTGQVIDPVGRRNPGAVVSRMCVDDVADATTADEMGAFEFVVRVYESVDLRAEAPGFIAGTASVETEPGTDAFVELHLGHPREIRGRVTDTRGLPISGATVKARALDNEYEMPDVSPYPQDPVSATDTEGRYLLTGLREGLHAVQATADGFLASTARGNSGDNGVSLSLTRSARIEGVVLGPEGDERPQDRRVEPFQPEPRQEVDRVAGHYVEPVDPFSDPMAWILGGERHADAEGQFTVNDLSPGVWVVRARAAGCAPTDSQAIHLDEGGAQRGVVIRLQRASVIRGRVLAADDGASVSGAEVWYHLLDETNGPLPSAAVRTGAEGRFLVPDLVAGNYRIEVRHGSFVRLEQIVGVAVGATTEVALELDRGARIEGCVTDRSGRPLVGADVIGSNPRVHDIHIVKTDGDGHYVISGMYPGRHDLTCTHARQGMTSLIRRTFDIRGGESVRMDLTCQEGATLRGRVLRAPDRTRSPELRLYFQTDSGGCRFVAIVDGEGGYCVDGVPPGVYRVHGGDIESRVEVPAGAAEVRVDFGLR